MAVVDGRRAPSSWDRGPPSRIGPGPARRSGSGTIGRAPGTAADGNLLCQIPRVVVLAQLARASARRLAARSAGSAAPHAASTSAGRWGRWQGIRGVSGVQEKGDECDGASVRLCVLLPVRIRCRGEHGAVSGDAWGSGSLAVAESNGIARLFCRHVGPGGVSGVASSLCLSASSMKVPPCLCLVHRLTPSPVRQADSGPPGPWLVALLSRLQVSQKDHLVARRQSPRFRGRSPRLRHPSLRFLKFAQRQSPQTPHLHRLRS